MTDAAAGRTADDTAFSARRGRMIGILIPTAWLLLFFAIPFLFVVKISLSEAAYSVPPVSDFLVWREGWPELQATWGNFALILDDPLYLQALLGSLRIALTSTILTLLIGYPMAYAIARAEPGMRTPLLLLVILPFWTSFLIRVYAWIGILKPEGLLNQFLMSFGLIGEPLTILNTDTAVYIGIVYSYLPFMVLPIYATLEKMDYSLIEAAQDLGCTALGAFWKVTARLALPGVLAGCLLVFIPAVGEFVIPDLLGGSDTLMIGKTLWTEFFNNRDWPVASAVAIILLILLVVPIVLFQNAQARAQESGS